MKKIALILLCFIGFSTYGQKADSLYLIKLNSDAILIQSKIKLLTDSLNTINKTIAELNNKLLLKKYSNADGNNKVSATILRDCPLKEKAHPMSTIIATIKAGQNMLIIDYIDGYYKIVDGTRNGFVSELYITETQEVLALKEEFKSLNSIKKQAEQDEKFRQERKDELDKQKQLNANEELRKQNLIKKYGKINGEKIFNHYFWIGMSKSMALDSLGEPNDINKSVGSWGVHEQWIYNGTNLYFENGVLTSYQN